MFRYIPCRTVARSHVRLPTRDVSAASVLVVLFTASSEGVGHAPPPRLTSCCDLVFPLASTASGGAKAREGVPAPQFGIKLWTVGFHGRSDIRRALEAAAKERPDALFVYPDRFAFMEAEQTANFALKHKLPTMYAFREFVDAGGLMSYGSNDAQMFLMAADQVGRIFDGVAARDLPMLQSQRFELVINMKTAKALGISIPPSVLRRADHILD